VLASDTETLGEGEGHHHRHILLLHQRRQARGGMAGQGIGLQVSVTRNCCDLGIIFAEQNIVINSESFFHFIGLQENCRK
jgi:hypothetical protein